MVSQLADKLAPLLLGQTDGFLVLAGMGREPVDRGFLEVLGDLLSLREQGITRGRVLHLLVFVGLGLHVFVFPVLLAFEFLGDAVHGDEFLEVTGRLGEMDLASHDGVEPALDDTPESYDMSQNGNFGPRYSGFDEPEKSQGALWTSTAPKDSG